MVSEISKRETPYDIIYMGNLKNKTNEQRNRDRIINTENKLVVARGERTKGWAK